MIDFVQVDNPGPNPDNAPSPTSITDELKKSGKPFDHGLFQQRVAELRTAVLDTGGIVFIPLIWGMPSPNESIITPGTIDWLFIMNQIIC